MKQLLADQLRQGFLWKLIIMALPIAFQMMLFSSRSLVDIVMLGQLSEMDVAAIGIAGKALFVVTIMMFGITSGGALLTAQYWGAKNFEGFKQSTGLTIIVTLVLASLMAIAFAGMSESIIGLATQSDAVIALGAEYLTITSISLLAVALGSSVAVGLRSMHQPGVSTFFSLIGIVLNIVLNGVLIFGYWGFPAMGIAGAAWATTISGLVEVGLLFGYLYATKHTLSLSFSVFKSACQWPQIKRFLRLSLPIASNALAWSAGIFTYHAIIGQQGVDGLIALSVITPIESLALALLIGISSASAVLIGNQLGANQSEEAYVQAWIVTGFNVLCSVCIATLMILIQDPILSLFSALDEETRATTERFFILFTIMIVIRSIPITLINGVLRAGGDIKFCFYQDVIAQWVIGIPIVMMAAWWWDCSLSVLFGLLIVEEIVKIGGSVWRVYSRRWVNNLTLTSCV